MADFFGANAGPQSTNISMNPVGNRVNPAVGTPIQSNSGATLASGTINLGGSGGMGGATSGKGGSGSDVRPDGKHTTGAMGPRLP